MDAIKYLRGEHSKFRKQFAAISKLVNEKTKKTKFKALCKDLKKHERMEETTWYPVLRKDPRLKIIIQDLIPEEKQAARAISSFNKKHFEMVWKLKFLKLKHDVDHHARHEERKLFPKVRKFLSKQKIDELGTKMRKFKAQLNRRG